jgi:hypothetical protein
MNLLKPWFSKRLETPGFATWTFCDVTANPNPADDPKGISQKKFQAV